MEQVPPTRDQLNAALAEHDPVKLRYEGHPLKDIVAGAEEILRAHRTRREIITSKLGDIAWRGIMSLRYVGFIYATGTYSGHTTTNHNEEH